MPRATGVRCRERIFYGTPGRRALRSVYRSCSVGRDHWARRCRNHQIRTNLFVFSDCRFADGDVCERRLWREERAKRSGRIKAIGERASHAMTSAADSTGWRHASTLQPSVVPAMHAGRAGCRKTTFVRRTNVVFSIAVIRPRIPSWARWAARCWARSTVRSAPWTVRSVRSTARWAPWTVRSALSGR